MIPSASTTYELGILLGCKTSGNLPFGSCATVNDQLGRELRKACALSLSSSTETAMISTPFFLSRPAMSSSSGISSIQGAHHEAQMSTSTTLPLSDAEIDLAATVEVLDEHRRHRRPDLAALVTLLVAGRLRVLVRGLGRRTSAHHSPGDRDGTGQKSDAKDTATISHWLHLHGTKGRTACSRFPRFRTSRPLL